MPVFAQLFDTVTAHNGVQVWIDQNAHLKNSTHIRVGRAVIHRKMFHHRDGEKEKAQLQEIKS